MKNLKISDNYTIIFEKNHKISDLIIQSGGKYNKDLGGYLISNNKMPLIRKIYS